jgi:hypothetical protein
VTDAPRQMDEPRKGHRYLVALVVALVVVALVAAALLWRYVPPREGTMNGVRSAIASFRAAEAPTLPAAAVLRGSLSAAEQQTLESQMAAQVQACCTSRYWHEEQNVPRIWTREVAEALRTGESLPYALPPGRVEFERRTWSGALVVRLVSEPVGVVAPPTEFVLRKVDGRWLIDNMMEHGD